MHLLNRQFFSLLIALMTAMTSSVAMASAMNGAGVSYMGPMYNILAKNYGAYDKTFSVAYRAMKFDDAINSIVKNSADFAIIDIPLPKSHIEQKKLLAFPTLITAIVPVVNVPGIKSDQLVLSGSVLADIMAGKIDNWNAADIKALNPSLTLPSLPIKRIVRETPSGATLSFTSYLARYSNDFKTNIGAGLTVKWPGDVVAVADSDAAANAMNTTEGAISYIEMDLGIIKFLKFASLKHKSGQVVQANPGFLRSGVVSARATSGAADDPELVVTDDGQNWPILLPIYVVMKQTAVDDQRSKDLLRFFYWNFHNGDRAVEYLGLVPLPASFQAKSIRIFRKVKSTTTGMPLQPEFEYERAQ